MKLDTERRKMRNVTIALAALTIGAVTLGVWLVQLIWG